VLGQANYFFTSANPEIVEAFVLAPDKDLAVSPQELLLEFPLFLIKKRGFLTFRLRTSLLAPLPLLFALAQKEGGRLLAAIFLDQAPST